MLADEPMTNTQLRALIESRHAEIIEENRRLRELLAEAKTQIHSPHSPTLTKIADALGETKGGA